MSRPDQPSRWSEPPPRLELDQGIIDVWLLPTAGGTPDELTATVLGRYGDTVNGVHTHADSSDAFTAVAVSGSTPVAVAVAGRALRERTRGLLQDRMRDLGMPHGELMRMKISGGLTATAAKPPGTSLRWWRPAGAEPRTPSRHRRPPCPPGWQTGPPDFVGVGAQRSGTSWWFDQLHRHPRLASTDYTHKELHYFDKFWRAPLGEAEIARYHELFPRPPGGVAGEWTPRYMHLPWVPALLARAAPDARLIVMLRDPLARFWSGTSRNLRHAEADGLSLRPEYMIDAIARSRYHEQLERLLVHYPRERVLVLQYERCVADPGEELARTFAFLGLEPADLDHDPPRSRPPRSGEPGLTPEAREAVRESIRPDLDRLLSAFPEIDRRLWPSSA